MLDLSNNKLRKFGPRAARYALLSFLPPPHTHTHPHHNNALLTYLNILSNSRNLCSLKKLVVLSLANNNLSKVPKGVWRLPELKSLKLEGNPSLLSKIPENVIKGGTASVIAHMNDIYGNRSHLPSFVLSTLFPSFVLLQSFF